MKRTLLSTLTLSVLATFAHAADTAQHAAKPALISGIDTQYIDTSVRPQDDFFTYLNGKWLKNTEIPADKASWGTFMQLRDDAQAHLREIIEVQTHPWGVDVSVVEIKDVEIPEAMQRAMAREAEAERERRAKVINARGEMQASGELRQAADELSKSPASLQLRYLQTLLELGADQNSTVVFPLPMDILAPFLRKDHGN